jgi:hypothetical protein
MLNQEQILMLSNDILSHVQNLDDTEDAFEFTRLYLLSLVDVTDEDKNLIVTDMSETDVRFTEFNF